ncbi:phage tail tip lysozyme [Sphingomonas sp. H39-1-10]|uniref:phage tail tip lysozyme n=1 Tax=Sphingomonas pollutisoli TaxID=3030829 RepID=UPI0023B983FD|nr:phage tail tip lysozyme [Sphingomonas pollutisoli]MDF0491603.1 phage tail tip lysozyme [Sphingomonas pollutisoli]
MADDIIKEFLVSIGVDDSGVAKFDKALSDVGKNLKVFTEIAAGATAAISVAVVKVANDFDKLYWQSKNLGSSVGDIKAIQYAFGQLGGSAEMASSAMASIANFKLAFGEGANGLLRSLGVAPEDLNDSAKTLIDLEKIFQRMAKRGPDGLAQANAYANAIGLGPDWLRVALRDTGQFEQQYKQMIGSVGVDLDDVADKAHRVQVRLEAVKARFGVLFDAAELKVLEYVTPLFEKIAASLGDVDTQAKIANGTLPLFIGLIGAAGTAAVIAAGPYVALAAAIASAIATYQNWESYQSLNPEEKDRYKQQSLARIKAIHDAMQVTYDPKTGWHGPDISKAMGLAGEGVVAGFTGSAIRDARNPSAGAAPSGGAGAALAAGTGQQIVDYFKRQGANDIGAQGIAAMLFSENERFDPNAANPKSGAWGIAQWLSADRIAEFKRQFGHDIHGSTLAEQLQFVRHELTTKYRGVWDRMKRAGSALEAAQIGIHGYEGPGTYDEISDGRRAARFLGVPYQSATAGPTVNQNIYMNISGNNAREIGETVRDSVANATNQAVTNASVYQF